MGKIRVEETKRFPFNDNECWYVLVYVKKGKPIIEAFTGAKYQKEELKQKLITLKNCTLLGIWHGQYRTDLFDLDPQIVKLYL